MSVVYTRMCVEQIKCSFTLKGQKPEICLPSHNSSIFTSSCTFLYFVFFAFCVYLCFLLYCTLFCPFPPFVLVSSALSSIKNTQALPVNMRVHFNLENNITSSNAGSIFFNILGVIHTIRKKGYLFEPCQLKQVQQTQMSDNPRHMRYVSEHALIQVWLGGHQDAHPEEVTLASPFMTQG